MYSDSLKKENNVEINNKEKIATDVKDKIDPFIQNIVNDLKLVEETKYDNYMLDMQELKNLGIEYINDNQKKIHKSTCYK